MLLTVACGCFVFFLSVFSVLPLVPLLTQLFVVPLVLICEVSTLCLESSGSVLKEGQRWSDSDRVGCLERQIAADRLLLDALNLELKKTMAKSEAMEHLFREAQLELKASKSDQTQFQAMFHERMNAWESKLERMRELGEKKDEVMSRCLRVEEDARIEALEKEKAEVKAENEALKKENEEMRRRLEEVERALAERIRQEEEEEEEEEEKDEEVRIAAEAEAARLEAERVQKEQVEAARIAAEAEAARLEAERVQKEKEAEEVRIAAEAEAERVQKEKEAEEVRIAAEAEAERVQKEKEAEAARIAAEAARLEAERVQKEQAEAARVAAEAEAARLEAERVQTEAAI